MATAKGGYFLKDGTRVPSVTTILSRWKESGALIHWSSAQAAKYVVDNLPSNPTKQDVGRICDAAKMAYRNVRDAAADAGTMAHDAVEAHIHGKPFEWSGDPDVVKKAKKAFGAFLEWAHQTQLKATDTEVPLVSERHRFAGTLDAMLVNGKLSLADWKTGGSLYTDHLCQMAAYSILWEENFPDRPIEAGFNLLRFDKTNGDFTARWFGELDVAKRSFLMMRELYEMDGILKARIK